MQAILVKCPACKDGEATGSHKRKTPVFTGVFLSVSFRSIKPTRRMGKHRIDLAGI